MPEEAGQATEAPATGNAGEQGGEESAASGFDISPLNDRLDQMQTQFSTGLEDLAARIPEQPAGPEQPDLDSFPDFFGDAGYGDDGLGYQEIDADQLQQGIDQMVEARTQQALGPLQEQMRTMIDAQAASAIEAKYPELQNQQVAEAAAMEAINSGVAPEDLSPAHIALAHEALKYRELQAQIKPEGAGGSDGMEGTGGAQPGSQSNDEFEQDVQNRIVAHGERRLFS
jgi:hypothetical protein